MNKTLIISIAISIAGTASIAFAYDYFTDARRSVEITFDEAEKTHLYAKEAKRKAQIALESATQNEANTYEAYKSARCSLAFMKLSNKEVVTDETKSLCGISESQGPDLSQ